MAKITLDSTSKGIQTALEGMIERGRSVEAFLNRVTFQQYKNYQVDRWQSSGASEGYPWANVKDSERKIRMVEQSMTPTRKKLSKKNWKARFQSNMTPTGLDAAGRVNMILTGRLADAATGRSANLLKIVTDSSLKVYIDDSVLPYAKYVGTMRPVMKFSQDHEAKMVSDVIAYMMGGVEA